MSKVLEAMVVKKKQYRCISVSHLDDNLVTIFIFEGR